MTDLLKVAKESVRLLQKSGERSPKRELIEEAIANVTAHRPGSDVYEDLLDLVPSQVIKLRREIRLESNPTANGSLMRSRYFAYSIPYARTIRKGLWGSTQPLFSAGIGDENLANALAQVWAWVEESPEVKRYKTSVVTEVDADGSESTVEEDRNFSTPIDFPKWVEGQFVETALPFTRRAYDLSDAVSKFVDRTSRNNKSPWWQPEWTAVYLTTGHFERIALPRWAVTRAGMQAVAGRSRGYAYIEVHDVASVSPNELMDAYIRTRQKMTERLSIPKFEVTAGRPEEYSSEVLAQLELELILAKADERFAKGESVRPEIWDERPVHKELANAWQEKAVAFGVDPDKRLTPQSLSNFRSRVRRDLYETALRDMRTDDDNQRVEDDNRRAIEEAARTDQRVREAFKRTPKE